MRQLRARRTRAVTLALLSALALGAGACNDGGDPKPRPTITEDNGVAALGAAIDAVNSSRKALLADTNVVVSAARSFDAGDAAAAVGDRSGMQALRKDIEGGHSKANPAVMRLTARAAAYDKALTALEAAAPAPALDDAQRASITAVVEAGRAEHAAMAAFATVTTRVWPTYRALHDDGTTWFTRARAGWYRNTQESANAYAVLVSDDRPALERARTALQKADADRARTAAATSRAITAARTALVDLVDLSP
jgi:hypothetical protein